MKKSIKQDEMVISIDPHKKHCDYVLFLDRKIISVQSGRKTEEILKQKSKEYNKNCIAIIENGWFGKNPKQNIEHAVLIGRLYQSFWTIGYQVILVSSWGKDAWQGKILGRGKRIPSREETAKLAIIRARADYSKHKWNEHTASAYCLAQYYFDFVKGK